MAVPPPLPEDYQDTQQLQLLVILHYVSAGLTFLGLLAVGVHYFVMSTVSKLFVGMKESEAEQVQVQPAPAEVTIPIEAATPSDLVGNHGDQSVETTKILEKFPSDFFETVFDSLVFFYISIATYLVLKIILNFMSARLISQRRGKVFSIVTAAVNCLSIPLGTALGVFTLVILARPSVGGAYERNEEA